MIEGVDNKLLDLEIISVKQDSVKIYYSLDEKYEKLFTIEAPATEGSSKVYELIMRRIKDKRNLDKDSLRLLIEERQHESCECFVWSDVNFRKMKYFSPMFTVNEQQAIEDMKKQCIEIIERQHFGKYGKGKA